MEFQKVLGGRLHIGYQAVFLCSGKNESSYSREQYGGAEGFFSLEGGEGVGPMAPRHPRLENTPKTLLMGCNSLILMSL